MSIFARKTKEKIEQLLTNNHNPSRHSLKTLIEGWRFISEGEALVKKGTKMISKGRELADEAVLEMIERKRQDDRPESGKCAKKL